MMTDNATFEKEIEAIKALQQQGDIGQALTRMETLLSKSSSENFPAKAFYGVLLLLSGNIEKGEKQISQASRVPPENSAWASDVGFGFLLLHNMDKALPYFHLAISLKNPDATLYNRLGGAYLAREDSEKALHAFETACLLDPSRAEIHSNLGGIKVRLGRLEEALCHYEKAMEIKNDLSQAINGRAAILIEKERIETLILEAQEKLENSEEEISTRKYLACLLEETGRFNEAFRHLVKALEKEPENISVLFQLAMMLYYHFKFYNASIFLKKISGIEPDNFFALSYLAKCYSEMGNHTQAEQITDKLFTIAPESPLPYLTRALILLNAGKYQETEEDLTRVLEILPGSAEAWGLLGQSKMHTGDMTGASTCFKNASRLNPITLSQLIEARIFPDDPEVIEKMCRIAQNPLIHRDPRISMCFALSRLFEKKNVYDQAFLFAEKGNRLTKKFQQFSFQNYEILFDRVQQIFSQDLIGRFKDAGSPSKRPIFIVGMPRSGTTLVEQILSSHSEIYGGDELGHIPAITRLMPRVLKTASPYPLCIPQLEPWMVQHAARYYLKKIEQINNDCSMVTDKLPHNFIHIGLISIIFPNAAIIHVKRNLKDIAVSNFFTNFKYREGILGYAFSQKDIGRMLTGYVSIINHFRNVLEKPFFEISYESLVENPEENIRDLFSYLNLKYDPCALEFHENDRAVKTASMWQVRQPLYQTSKERWRNYESSFSPLFKELDTLQQTF